jgi:hypothetical protein
MSVSKRFAPILLLISVVPTSALSQAPANNQNVHNLINELQTHRWEGPFVLALPLEWDLRFTEPMRQILELGSSAQEPLIEHIADSPIKDQIIMLLGGVGDERSVGPIINAMIGRKDLKSTPNSQQINLAANIALTNITVADVVWHYGGGLVRVEPPEDSKERWMKWWRRNVATFTAKSVIQSRHYSNYPNYGIYRQQ